MDTCKPTKKLHHYTHWIEEKHFKGFEDGKRNYLSCEIFEEFYLHNKLEDPVYDRLRSLKKVRPRRWKKLLESVKRHLQNVEDEAGYESIEKMREIAQIQKNIGFIEFIKFIDEMMARDAKSYSDLIYVFENIAKERIDLYREIIEKITLAEFTKMEWMRMYLTAEGKGLNAVKEIADSKIKEFYLGDFDCI